MVDDLLFHDPFQRSPRHCSTFQLRDYQLSLSLPIKRDNFIKIFHFNNYTNFLKIKVKSTNKFNYQMNY